MNLFNNLYSKILARVGIRTVFVCGLIITWLVGTPVIAGLVYNPTTQFSTTNNPNGVWSYGGRQQTNDVNAGAGATFGAFDSYNHIYTSPSNPLQGWTFQQFQASSVTVNYGVEWVPEAFGSFLPQELTLNPDGSERPVVRFTAPEDIQIQFSQAEFTRRFSTHSGLVWVYVLHNNTQLFAQGISGDATGTPTTTGLSLLNLSSGDTLDFIVGFRTAGGHTYGSTSTQLNVEFTASAVPEPSSLLLAGVGLVGSGLLAPRRRRRQ